MNVVGPIGRVRLRSPGRLVVEMASRWELWVGTLLYAASAAAWVLALSTASAVARVSVPVPVVLRRGA